MVEWERERIGERDRERSTIVGTILNRSLVSRATDIFHRRYMRQKKETLSLSLSLSERLVCSYLHAARSYLRWPRPFVAFCLRCVYVFMVTVHFSSFCLPPPPSLSPPFFTSLLLLLLPFLIFLVRRSSPVRGPLRASSSLDDLLCTFAHLFQFTFFSLPPLVLFYIFAGRRREKGESTRRSVCGFWEFERANKVLLLFVSSSLHFMGVKMCVKRGLWEGLRNERIE